ncbi:hypothetical protein U9M48_006186 [Paspalum notatum var. saurae]|uniref:RING-type domain-containing protein n=1 Tax=Paspalum notatum var. saurae TaxID=547442 RepID=A0AAQ3PTU3_PASNO
MEMEEEVGRHAQAQRRRRPRSPAASSSSSLLSPPPPTAPTHHAVTTPYDYLVQLALPPVEEEEPPPPSKRACIAASYEAMQGLQLRHVMPSDLTAGDADDCAICLTSLLLVHPSSSSEDPDPIRAMPCSHAFHQRCIFQWLSRNAICPLCRHALPTTHPSMTVHGRTFYTLDEEDRYIRSLGDAIINLQDGTEEEEEEVVDEEREARIRAARAFAQRWRPPTPPTIIIDPRTGIQIF